MTNLFDETVTILEIHGKTIADIEYIGSSEKKINTNKALELMKKNGKIVLLTASPETIYERVKYSNERPLLNGNMNVEYIKDLMEKRKDRYESIADIVVDTNNKPIHVIAEEVVSKLATL